MPDDERALMAHFLRRAGFGATPDELDTWLATGYEAAVELLLHPGDPDPMPEDLIRRYHVDQSELRIVDSAAAHWLYRMITTKAPLEEKIALFWHSLFATGERKVNQAKTLLSQIETFRRHGLSSFPTLLVQLSKDPAMIYWLDNSDNHEGAINENYGRELLELFSMGVGNYTEEDIKECSRAFTGWTIQNAEYMALRSHKASIWPYGRVAWQFEYDPEGHDDGEKTLLGDTGRLNGDDAIDIIARHPATPRFISRRLYQFFVADAIDAEGEHLVDQLVEEYSRSGFEIRSMLRTLFNSDLFKTERVRFARVKSPVELVVGTLRLAAAVTWPTMEVREAAVAAGYMGQELLNPPNVEGWHEGPEWIDTGAMVERVNFASHYLSDAANPGIAAIVDRLGAVNAGDLSPEQIVDGCLDLLGPIRVSDSTRQAVIESIRHVGDVNLSRSAEEESARVVTGALRLIASSPEFQLA